MNFMQWLKALDDLLYEIMSWLVFYPVTLWRAITKPLTMMDYARAELQDKSEEQFTDTLGPPLFLLVSLFVSHGVEISLGGGTNPIVARKDGLASLISDDSTLLMLRLVVFSVFPLVLAVQLLRAKKIALTKPQLKAPFYAQCYAAAPFALLIGVGISISHIHHDGSRPLGLAIVAIGCAFYVAVQIRWFAHHLGSGFLHGVLNALVGLIGGAFLALAISFLFAGNA